MKTIFFLVLLLQYISAQQDSLRRIYLERSASGITQSSENIQLFFDKFFPEDKIIQDIDTNKIFYFDVTFSSKPEYNINAKLINVDFNYQLADKNCNNSNRNGILLLEKIKRTPAAKQNPEKLDRDVFVLIPDKCSTTRFYNSGGNMFCDNKRQYPLEYDEGKALEEKLKVRIGIQLLAASKGNFYDKLFPAEKNYPVETHLKEYVLRCCIRSIVILKGDEIIDNFVSLK